jgi:enoyl-CoA hydratase/carnithine racemase
MFTPLTQTLRRLFSTSTDLVRTRRLTGSYKDVVAVELNQPKKKNALSIALLDQVSTSSNVV